MLADVKRVALLLSKPSVLGPEYKKHGKYSLSTLEKRFGSWIKCLKAIGFDITGREKNASPEELFINLEEVWIKLGRQPVYKDMHAPLSKYSGKPYVLRFGSWLQGLKEFVKFVNQDEKPPETFPEPDAITPKLNEVPPTHKTSRNINWRLRFLVMRRDNFKCRNCGRSPAKNPEIELHLDHIVAYSKGGETAMDNLQTLCSMCNIGKSDL